MTVGSWVSVRFGFRCYTRGEFGRRSAAFYYMVFDAMLQIYCNDISIYCKVTSPVVHQTPVNGHFFNKNL